MRVTTKGQITIPADIREEAGLLPHTEVDVVFDGKTVKIVKAPYPRRETRGRRLVERLKRNSTHGMSTDEIMALTREQ